MNTQTTMRIESNMVSLGNNGLQVTVYGTPQPAGSKKAVPMGKRWGVIDDNRKSRPWKDQVAQHAGIAMAGRDLFRGPLAVELTFHVRRPKGHFGSGRNAAVLKPSAPDHPTVKPDVLKLARGVEDALSGVVYGDDAQIVDERLRKVYGAPERVVIVVREL